MTNAVLLKNVPLVVRDVSTGGCLFESRTPLPVGTIGLLEVEIEGQCRFEWFRIARVHAESVGGSGWLAGVEFLPFAVAGGDSLRGAVGRLRPSVYARTLPGLTGRSSGDPGNSVSDSTSGQSAPVPTHGNSTGKVVEFARRAPQARPGNVIAHVPDMGAPAGRGPAENTKE